ncbi:MAG: pyridoxamine 5'-phosphate oxidase [Acidobacteria bacterium RIFCSPLOWO2_12_FULL_67_14]|nr:MAG: pyridoxamine 5'-phosphate oxidase [Acidobacteria bacterium RIFCSPLOWO2_02_FULL_67_21]OFW34878.1 MAG: pyridoxamine 5'-phosphate oxidase [Acidobacteria bacterium RIFCSPLOWO2_12_FULL_67_14]
MSLSDIRREYLGEPLDEAHSDPDPFRQFSIWFEQVRPLEPDQTAMALATATRDGHPSVRTVLLKGVDARGFVFFTNYGSRKAREIEQTGRAGLLFLWRSVERQVRIAGSVERVSGEESDAYFATRPIESRWSVYASRQSERLHDRAELDAAYAAAREAYGDRVARPPWWGGYRVMPDEFEFWQGRENRLHDRLEYRRSSDGSWTRERLAP